ncbi:hemolysin-III related-domain-containing protein [Russula vinacea]|nr:hemolysin-III related-domain-containing protein [Russula vinacea]
MPVLTPSLFSYRELNSWRKCLRSVFGYLHNETVNIHTHLHASILFAFFLRTFSNSYFKAYEDISWADHAVFVVFLSSASFCLLCSAFYHTVSSHSKQVTLIIGSFYPCVYYGFYCDSHYKIGYLLLITLTGLAAAYIHPAVSHLLVSHGVYTPFREMGFLWLLAAGVMYITGALLYAYRIPERLYPGRFDYFLSSHQIFHIFVVLAALSTYVCVLTAFDHRHSRGGMCVS